MGCSSYVKFTDESGEPILIQFKYGFLRELNYKVGDPIQWIVEELPASADPTTDALVPGWDQDPTRHDRFFRLSVENNILSNVTEITESEADRLERGLDGDGRHCWKRQCT